MKKYKPLIDQLYFWMLIPTLILISVMTVLSAFAPLTLLITIPIDLFVIWFLISPLFGYAELRERSVFIKYGLIMKKEIPYEKIRGLEKKRKIAPDSMLSLKNALDHVNIKYNKYDVACISIIDSDEFIEAILEKANGKLS